MAAKVGPSLDEAPRDQQAIATIASSITAIAQTTRELQVRAGRGGRGGNRGGQGSNRGGQGSNRGGQGSNRGGQGSNRGGQGGNRGGGRGGNRGGREDRGRSVTARPRDNPSGPMPPPPQPQPRALIEPRPAEPAGGSTVSQTGKTPRGDQPRLKIPEIRRTKCGACHQDHDIRFCPRPNTEDGRTKICPVCDTSEHAWCECKHYDPDDLATKWMVIWYNRRCLPTLVHDDTLNDVFLGKLYLLDVEKSIEERTKDLNGKAGPLTPKFVMKLLPPKRADERAKWALEDNVQKQLDAGRKLPWELERIVLQYNFHRPDMAVEDAATKEMQTWKLVEGTKTKVIPKARKLDYFRELDKKADGEKERQDDATAELNSGIFETMREMNLDGGRSKAMTSKSRRSGRTIPRSKAPSARVSAASARASLVVSPPPSRASRHREVADSPGQVGQPSSAAPQDDVPPEDDAPMVFDDHSGLPPGDQRARQSSQVSADFGAASRPASGDEAADPAAQTASEAAVLGGGTQADGAQPPTAAVEEVYTGPADLRPIMSQMLIPRELWPKDEPVRDIMDYGLLLALQGAHPALLTNRRPRQ
ncbi:hypothetical protein KVR01_012508 [Diaporthe batatas]|uniref:uncharacterized protein n=1 Tax=Diaporthe batatas TaxID=748121 RepID=UPI001D04CA1A|nr:uncharacterized protein KVR01_012508 [Diaporthe batatas]KAG8157846.1 hypothetical protein KVR01_012508 [Diaporthe batatas]